MKSKTKRAFFGCALLVILMSVLMLESTMAWFNDTKIVINTYTFGDLDVDIMHKTNDQIVSATAVGFKRCGNIDELYQEGEFLFEPGATFRLEDVYIKNSGSVPLKYKLEVDTDGAVVVGDENLFDALDIYMKINGNIVSGDTPQHLDAGEMSDPVQIFLHMKETAGNEFQDLSVSGAVVKVLAVQNTGFSDDDFDSAFPEPEPSDGQ